MQRNQVIKAVKEMVLAPSIKESENLKALMVLTKPCEPGQKREATQRVINTSYVLVSSSGILQILSSTNTQTAELSNISLNILDIQVIITYYRTLQ